MAVFPGNHQGTLFSMDLEASINLPRENILLLTESNVPSLSLNGRNTGELNLVQLK